MVGNSLRSDIAPVIELGGFGIYMPYHVTWAHERDSDFSADTARVSWIEGAEQIPAAVAKFAAQR